MALHQLDLTIIQQAAKGDSDAFATLFDEYYQPVYNYALWLSGDPDLAEDVTQETFIRAHRNIHKLRPPFNVRAWLFRMAHNLFIDEKRGNPASQPLDTDTKLRAADVDPERQLLWTELSNPVRGALQRLSPSHREALVLREVEGFDYADIAAVMGVSLDNVKVLLHRARNHFKASYSQRLLQEDPQPECEVLAELLDAYRDKELPAEQADFVRLHVKDCKTCQQRKRELAVIILLFGSQPIISPPADLHDDLAARLRKRGRPGQSSAKWTWLAGVAGVGAIIIGWLIATFGPGLGQKLIGGPNANATPTDTPTPLATQGNPPPPAPPPMTPSAAATLAVCDPGWLPNADCTCCGTTLVCASGIVAEFNPQCGVGNGEPTCTCSCINPYSGCNIWKNSCTGIVGDISVCP